MELTKLAMTVFYAFVFVKEASGKASLNFYNLTRMHKVNLIGIGFVSMVSLFELINTLQEPALSLLPLSPMASKPLSAAMNVTSLSAWLEGRPHAPTRTLR